MRSVGATETVVGFVGTGVMGRSMAGHLLDADYALHVFKDMRIALESARRMELELPGLELAERLYEELAGAGHGDDGTQALFRLYTED